MVLFALLVVDVTFDSKLLLEICFLVPAKLVVFVDAMIS